MGDKKVPIKSSDRTPEVITDAFADIAKINPVMKRYFNIPASLAGDPWQVAQFTNAGSKLTTKFTITIDFGNFANSSTDPWPTLTPPVSPRLVAITSHISIVHQEGNPALPALQRLLQGVDGEVNMRRKRIAQELYHEMLHARLRLESQPQWPVKNRTIKADLDNYIANAKTGANAATYSQLRAALLKIYTLISSQPAVAGTNTDNGFDFELEEKFVAMISWSSFGVAITDQELAHAWIRNLSKKIPGNVPDSLRGQVAGNVAALEPRMIAFLKGAGLPKLSETDEKHKDQPVPAPAPSPAPGPKPAPSPKPGPSPVQVPNPQPNPDGAVKHTMSDPWLPDPEKVGPNPQGQGGFGFVRPVQWAFNRSPISAGPQVPTMGSNGPAITGIPGAPTNIGYRPFPLSAPGGAGDAFPGIAAPVRPVQFGSVDPPEPLNSPPIFEPVRPDPSSPGRTFTEDFGGSPGTGSGWDPTRFGFGNPPEPPPIPEPPKPFDPPAIPEPTRPYEPPEIPEPPKPYVPPEIPEPPPRPPPEIPDRPINSTFVPSSPAAPYDSPFTEPWHPPGEMTGGFKYPGDD